MASCEVHDTGGGAGSAKPYSGDPKPVDGAEAPTTPYKRPSGATTRAQRESVQGKPCVKCGEMTSKQVAGHKKALVEEYYETGAIDRDKMRSLDAIQSECPTCSAREGAAMANYSKQKKKELGL